MSGAIAYALKKIMFTIPQPIINEVFTVKKYSRSNFYNVQTVESIIKEKIICDQVIPDLSLYGGVETTIPISTGWITRFEDPPRTLITIPPEARQLEQIVSVLTVGFTSYNAGYVPTIPATQHFSSNQLANYAKMAMDASSAIQPMASTATYITPDGGGIVILDAPRITLPLAARVILGYNQEMSQLSPRLYPAFAELCILMTKAYIYNQYDIEIDKGQVMGGVTIGRFAERIREYDSAQQEYEEKIQDWLAGEIFSNPASKINYFDSIIGVGR